MADNFPLKTGRGVIEFGVRRADVRYAREKFYGVASQIKKFSKWPSKEFKRHPTDCCSKKTGYRLKRRSITRHA
jgi:hypothetical protein